MEEEGEEEETNGGERTLVRWGVLPGRYLIKNIHSWSLFLEMIYSSFALFSGKEGAGKV